MNALWPISLLAAAGFTVSALTFAEDAATPDVAKLLESGQILSQEAIIKRATEQHPGKVSEVELERDGDGYVYEIDIVDHSGTKTEFKLDAKSGEVLSSKIDDDDYQAKGDSEEEGDDDDDDD
jgi:uncharacterized membrane protein YkoI